MSTTKTPTNVNHARQAQGEKSLALAIAATGSAGAEFTSLIGERKLRSLRHAQAALRFLEADLADEPVQIASRRQALADLASGVTHLGWPAELAVQHALPSYQAYWDTYVVAGDLRSALEELVDDDEDVDPLTHEGFERLERVMKHLLGFARDEAELLGINLDELMRGWFAGARVPHGSPTAGISR